mmetsp:Transcript_15460/g.43261  ORF Transcript_15460/g.43261 Transcript_15460/m.43261 type:complete len:426 (+) Transcript_15460:222-1499(+)
MDVLAATGQLRLLRLPPPQPDALPEGVQGGVDLCALFPRLRIMVHAVVVALAPGAVHQRQLPGAHRPAHRHPRHTVGARGRRVGRRGGRRPACLGLCHQRQRLLRPTYHRLLRPHQLYRPTLRLLQQHLPVAALQQVVALFASDLEDGQPHFCTAARMLEVLKQLVHAALLDGAHRERLPAAGLAIHKNRTLASVRRGLHKRGGNGSVNLVVGAQLVKSSGAGVGLVHDVHALEVSVHLAAVHRHTLLRVHSHDIVVTLIGLIGKQRPFPEVHRHTEAVVCGNEALRCLLSKALLKAGRDLGMAIAVPGDGCGERRAVVLAALPLVHHLPGDWVVVLLADDFLDSASRRLLEWGQLLVRREPLGGRGAVGTPSDLGVHWGPGRPPASVRASGFLWLADADPFVPRALNVNADVLFCGRPCHALCP